MHAHAHTLPCTLTHTNMCIEMHVCTYVWHTYAHTSDTTIHIHTCTHTLLYHTHYSTMTYSLRFWNMLLSGKRDVSLNAIATWWCSKVDLSMYRNVRSCFELRRNRLVLPRLCPNTQLFTLIEHSPVLKYCNRTVAFVVRIECSGNWSSDNRQPTVLCLNS